MRLNISEPTGDRVAIGQDWGYFAVVYFQLQEPGAQKSAEFAVAGKNGADNFNFSLFPHLKTMLWCQQVGLA